MDTSLSTLWSQDEAQESCISTAVREPTHPEVKKLADVPGLTETWKDTHDVSLQTSGKVCLTGSSVEYSQG